MSSKFSKILCVTNRNLCGEEFLLRIEKIAAAGPDGIILREKDLSRAEYKALAEYVLQICDRYQVPCILHTFVDVAMELGAKAIHLPLPVLRDMTAEERAWFTEMGASCHSVEDVTEAETLGCTYVTAGHIFETDCKMGLPGRGLEFLAKACERASVPVYAIGGISAENMGDVLGAGAKGACVMSGLMKCADAEAYLGEFSD